MEPIYNFKKKSFDRRFKESSYMMEKYPESICCIIEKSNTCKNLCELKKNKYIIPKDLTISQIIYIIRKRIVLDSKMSIFIFINNKIPTSNIKISEIYEENKDDDGFLYIKYAGENTFG
jgi:GABA(A) receptor-associated protein|tara:strand:+ start:72 stop:428 length:357 start_codon:yes stop_codon:yes gene_type:complete